MRREKGFFSRLFIYKYLILIVFFSCRRLKKHLYFFVTFFTDSFAHPPDLHYNSAVR